MQLKKHEMRTIFNKLRMKTRKTHHYVGWFQYKGKDILKTRFSFGKGEIPKPVVRKIMSQLKLDASQFEQLRDCPLDYDEYVKVLEKKGFLKL